MLSKIVILLLITGFCISILKCDDSIELSCLENSDCKSYENKKILSACINASCLCSVRITGEAISCNPIVTKVNNVANYLNCNFPNTENINGTCITSVVHLGKSCDQTRQCSKFDKSSECSRGVCECKKNFVEIERVCRSLIGIEKCTDNSQCNKNAECYDGKCVCNNSFISSSNLTQCLPFGSFGESCIEDIQCEYGLGFGSICENKLCKCNSSYIAVSNDDKKFQCLPKVFVGDSCETDSDCLEGNNQRMICQSKKCQCLEGYEMVELNGINQCVKQIIIPSSLSSSAFCQSALLFLVASAQIFSSLFL